MIDPLKAAASKAFMYSIRELIILNDDDWADHLRQDILDAFAVVYSVNIDDAVRRAVTTTFLYVEDTLLPETEKREPYLRSVPSLLTDIELRACESSRP